MRDAEQELESRGFVVASGLGRTLTPAGQAIFTRYMAARRATLTELFEDWDPAHHDELARAIARMAQGIEETPASVRRGG